MTETTSLFFKENDNIIEYFYNKKIVLSDASRSNIKEITTKASNSLIGYYQFKEQDLYYKIYVLPKIYKKSNDNDVNIEYFFSFIKNYYELKKAFPQITPKAINSNIVDLALDSKSPADQVNTINDLMQLKYTEALKTVKIFFKKHNKSASKTVSYTSQSVKHKINLGMNIRELDKSKIHQDKNVSVVYSKLAFIAVGSLEYFLKHRVEAENIETKKMANQAKSLILKKFTADRNFSFKVKEITKDKISKLFSKNNDYRKLYDALITLLGAEFYSNGSDKKKATKVNNMSALYFDPALLYEWYVYQHINTENNSFIDIEYYSTKFDKIDSSTSLSYEISDDSGYHSSRKSNPDFILENDDVILVIDAKWKIFDNDSDGSHGLKIEDVIKLQRDVDIRKYSSYPKVVQASLIYSKVSEKYKNKIFTVRYPLDGSVFKFKVIEVPYL